MTSPLLIGDPPEIPGPASYGLITSGVGVPAVIRNLVGGEGTARWTMLIYGMHLPGPWGTVEYVELGPGSSCGTHLHDRREEVYYILGGAAVMTVNGRKVDVAAGDLVTCPLGTVHGIGVPDGAAEGMRMLVIEVSPGPSAPPRQPARITVPPLLAPCGGYRGGGHGQETRAAVVDLARHLTGPWRKFSLIEIPVGDSLGPYRLPAGTAEVLFVQDGLGEITAAGTRFGASEGIAAGPGLDAEVLIRNISPRRPLLVLSAEVAV